MADCRSVKKDIVLGGGTPLANYLESTYSPTIGDGTNDFTLSQSIGIVTRIGAMVHIEASMTWTDQNSASGNVLISLPVTLIPAVRGGGVIATSDSVTNPGNVTEIAVQILDSVSTTHATIQLISGNGGAAAALQVSSVDAAGTLALSFDYTL